MDYEYYKKNTKNFESILYKLDENNLTEIDKDLIGHIADQISYYEGFLKKDNSEKAEEIKKTIENAKEKIKYLLC